MTKDEEAVLDLALEALQEPLGFTGSRQIDAKLREAITAIKQARALDKKAENARELGLDYEPPCKTGSQCTSKCQQCVVQEPVAWKWHQAPVKTSWGHDMVVADLAIDKDNTVSVYCERDQTTKVVAMFTPPAAQRQWVGLTDEEIEKGRDQTFSINNPYCPCDSKTMRKAVRWAEAKLKEKNT